MKIAFSTSANNPEINAIEILPAENRPVPSRGLPPPKSTSAALPTIRMRAGSTKPYTDSKGNKWLPDETTKDGGFEGGDMSDRPADMPIENTKDPDLYRFEHWGMDSFNYKLPNGKYVVKLHFAETYDGISGPGGRVFTFKVQDKEFKDFDVWKKPAPISAPTSKACRSILLTASSPSPSPQSKIIPKSTASRFFRQIRQNRSERAG